VTREPRWLPREVVLALHHDQLLEHGGSFGLRDASALDEALTRPRRRWESEVGVPLTALAAAYGHAIGSAAPFVAGNERAAFLAMYAFLALNGLRVVAPGDDVQATMRRVATGELLETTLAEWLEAHVEAR
jgi:death on curing protein